MTIAVPKLADLAAAVRAAFRTELPGSDATVWPNNLGPTAKVFAGALWAIYLRLDFIAAQIFAATAVDYWLDRHAAEYGMARLPPALSAGNMTMTASGAASIASGAVLQRSDGVQVVTTASGTLTGAGSVSVPIAAIAAGKAGNFISGTPLSAVSGVTGTPTFAVDASGLGGGADSESDDALRVRVLFRKRNPPQGGAAADYVAWAMSVPGVTRVFVERLWAGAGSVRVFPLTDNLTTNGIPSSATISAVQAVMAANAPAGAAVTVVAPTAQPINITITGRAPNTTPVQNAVIAEINDAFLRLGQVAGSDTVTAGLPFLATAQTFSRSWIWQAAANATGEQRHQLTTPSADVTVTTGDIPVPGTITFA